MSQVESVFQGVVQVREENKWWFNLMLFIYLLNNAFDTPQQWLNFTSLKMANFLKVVYLQKFPFQSIFLYFQSCLNFIDSKFFSQSILQVSFFNKCSFFVTNVLFVIWYNCVDKTFFSRESHRRIFPNFCWFNWHGIEAGVSQQSSNEHPARKIKNIFILLAMGSQIPVYS